MVNRPEENIDSLNGVDAPDEENKIPPA